MAADVHRVINQTGRVGVASVIRFEEFVQRGRARLSRLRDRSTHERRDAVHPAPAVDKARALNQLIECEIIPRLLVAHAAPIAPTDAAHSDRIADTEVAAFAPLALQVEADELLEHVEALIARGVSRETLLVDLLAPAARMLGQFWEEDRCDFVDVTMGLWRLQEVVHEIFGRATPDGHIPSLARRALFASLEGDQHSFGTVVVDELFCAHGWMTDRLAEATQPQLLERVRDTWFDLVGLTITCDCHIAPLPSIVRSIRAASCNPRICVMVGGRVFALDASRAAAVGADGTAPDARAAVRVAGELVDAVAREAVASMTG
ncbi:cobalamin B12-binding domain-containing protein [Sphingomonas glacialis]|uniref:Cobalamin B12-binding domain-containing protein n=1 Tax=Sphingomonas glacialis TaxID=658225 RepID=A0A502FUW6_9SPHN|nr:cobalamin B12-binding domain-containing protein [Sphingomonas glacialis]TPG52896.1 cobalamin B12-binding domain-containing protein [Sphingomonas glacialis]